MLIGAPTSPGIFLTYANALSLYPILGTTVGTKLHPDISGCFCESLHEAIIEKDASKIDLERVMTISRARSGSSQSESFKPITSSARGQLKVYKLP